MKQAKIKDYGFAAPLVILPSSLCQLEEEEWQSEKTWIETLAKIDARGIVLPLELQAPNRKRQHLFGIDLLSWLRWSAAEFVRYLPVLAVAWQPLADVLRRGPNLLVVAKGSRFARLPDVLKENFRSLSEFIRLAQKGDAEKCDEPAIDLCATAGAERTRQQSVHDLANDYYAAYRLWTGYLAALEEATKQAKGDLKKSLQQRSTQAEALPLDCKAKMEDKRRQPTFQQCQFLARYREVPGYPRVDGGQEVFLHHISHGLPKNYRILFVDDEFHKGMAEVLLQIVFGKSSFTRQIDGEWIYSDLSESNRSFARFVCVKDAETARHWLRVWNELEIESGSESFKAWAMKWARALGWPQDRISQYLYSLKLTCDVFSETKLDDPPKTKGKPNTIVLLDLFLRRKGEGRGYSPSELPSAKLWQDIKKYRRALPVVMFTANREAQNYIELMEERTPFDGWLLKEAPDMVEKAENSKNALLYLLTRLYLFSGQTDYDPAWGWTIDAQTRYLRMFVSESREKCLETVKEKSNEFLGKVRKGIFCDDLLRERGEKGHLELRGFFSRRCESSPFSDVVSVLVARRVIVATLVLTAKVKDGEFDWDPKAFYSRLLGKDAAVGVSAVYERLNFPEALWLSTSDPQLLELLRPDESKWLLQQRWHRKTGGILRKRLSPLIEKKGPLSKSLAR